RKLARSDLALAPHLPPFDVVARALDAARQWSQYRRTAEQALAYAATKEGEVWAHARQLLRYVKPWIVMTFDAVPRIGDEYRSLRRFLLVGREIGKRSAATRKKRAKEKAGPAPDASSAKPAKRRRRST